MATNTYVALDKVTVSGSSTSSITFNSISSGYTDLVVVASVACSVNDNSIAVRFNSDTGSNYSDTALRGNGSAASSVRNTSITSIPVSKDVSPTTTLGEHNLVFSVMNYSNSTTYKTTLSRSSSPVSGTYVGAEAVVGLWRSTSAITSVTVLVGAGVFSAGSTFSLYGIKAEPAPTAKATGGTITYDVGYTYHTFTSSGTFTPTQALSADYVIVAGGGGGGGGIAQNYAGSGGGAGGLRAFASQSLSATGYTVTVGAGGSGVTSGGSAATNGANSSFNGNSVTGGGHGGNGGAGSWTSGGSGGGATADSTIGGAGNAGGYSPVEGYAGGGGYHGADQKEDGGGGGGAGGVGGDASSYQGGAGGPGTYTYNSINFSGWLTATSTGVSGYLAGGGGGGTRTGATAGAGGSGGGGAGSVASSTTVSTAGNNATANTGSGGGGGGPATSGTDNKAGGNGGSGIVIIRYAN